MIYLIHLIRRKGKFLRDASMLGNKHCRKTIWSFSNVKVRDIFHSNLVAFENFGFFVGVYSVQERQLVALHVLQRVWVE